MRLIVNGEPIDAKATKVDALLGELDYEGTHLAVAVNYDVVPRARWESVAASAHRVRDREDAIRSALAAGRRLAELMDVPEPPA